MVVLVFRTFVCVCVCVVLSEVFVRVHACVSMFLYSIIPVGGCEKNKFLPLNTLEMQYSTLDRETGCLALEKKVKTSTGL